VNLSEVTHRADDAAATTAAAVVAAATTAAAAAATLETVESFGIGYGQGAGESTGNWMKPPGNLFLYPTLDMKDLTGSVEDMVLSYCHRPSSRRFSSGRRIFRIARAIFSTSCGTWKPRPPRRDAPGRSAPWRRVAWPGFGLA